MKENKTLKILIIDAGDYQIYGRAFYNALQNIGYKNTELFTWKQFFCKRSFIGKYRERIEKKVACGITINKINRELLRRTREFAPDLIFLYSGRLIYASTCKKLKQYCKMQMMYCNDDPFSKKYPFYFWRNYRKSLKYADYTFVYRISNLESVKEYGCNQVELLRSYYIKQSNYWIESDHFQSKAVTRKIGFIGHYENDGRDKYIQALIDSGIEVQLTPTWEKHGFHQDKVVIVSDKMEDYNQMLNNLDIAIIFLSKLNHDTYTRRCFEIPITKTMMLCEYSEDIATLFEEDKEIVFFRDEKEFVQKAKYYLDSDVERQNIIEAAYERVMKDGHEAEDRVRQILEVYYKEV